MPTRREFLGDSAVVACACLVGATGCGGGAPKVSPAAIQHEANTVRLALDQVPELAQVGGSVRIDDPITSHLTQP